MSSKQALWYLSSTSGTPYPLPAPRVMQGFDISTQKHVQPLCANWGDNMGRSAIRATRFALIPLTEQLMGQMERLVTGVSGQNVAGRADILPQGFSQCASRAACAGVSIQTAGEAGCVVIRQNKGKGTAVAVNFGGDLVMWESGWVTARPLPFAQIALCVQNPSALTYHESPVTPIPRRQRGSFHCSAKPVLRCRA